MIIDYTITKSFQALSQNKTTTTMRKVRVEIVRRPSERRQRNPNAHSVLWRYQQCQSQRIMVRIRPHSLEQRHVQSVSKRHLNGNTTTILVQARIPITVLNSVKRLPRITIHSTHINKPRTSVLLTLKVCLMNSRLVSARVYLLARR